MNMNWQNQIDIQWYSYENGKHIHVYLHVHCQHMHMCTFICMHTYLYIFILVQLFVNYDTNTYIHTHVLTTHNLVLLDCLFHHSLFERIISVYLPPISGCDSFLHRHVLHWSTLNPNKPQTMNPKSEVRTLNIYLTIPHSKSRLHHPSNLWNTQRFPEMWV